MNNNRFFNVFFNSYNYQLGKKFKFLKNETIMISDILFILSNRNDKRSLENIQSNIDEILKLNQNVKLFVLLINESNNILSNLLFKISDPVKLKFEGIERIIEINDIDDFDINEILSNELNKK